MIALTTQVKEVKADFETEMFKERRNPGKTYLVFTTTGESMNGGKLGDFKAGYDLLGEYIAPEQYEHELTYNKRGYVIITARNSYHKDIVSYNPDSGSLFLKSRNPEADLNTLFLSLTEEVIIYKVVGCIG